MPRVRSATIGVAVVDAKPTALAQALELLAVRSHPGFRVHSPVAKENGMRLIPNSKESARYSGQRPEAILRCLICVASVV